MKLQVLHTFQDWVDEDQSFETDTNQEWFSDDSSEWATEIDEYEDYINEEIEKLKNEIQEQRKIIIEELTKQKINKMCLNKNQVIQLAQSEVAEEAISLIKTDQLFQKANEFKLYMKFLQEMEKFKQIKPLEEKRGSNLFSEQKIKTWGEGFQKKQKRKNLINHKLIQKLPRPINLYKQIILKKLQIQNQIINKKKMSQNKEQLTDQIEMWFNIKDRIEKRVTEGTPIEQAVREEREKYLYGSENFLRKQASEKALENKVKTTILFDKNVGSLLFGKPNNNLQAFQIDQKLRIRTDGPSCEEPPITKLIKNNY